MPQFVLMPGDTFTIEGVYQRVPWWKRVLAWWRPPPQKTPLVYVVTDVASFQDGVWSSLAKPQE